MVKFFTYVVALILAFIGLAPAQTAFSSEFEQSYEFKVNVKKMSVYPTPSTNYVTISLPNGLRENTAKLEVMDITGRKVLEQKKYDPSTSEITFNNISDLPAGVYIISAVDQEGRILQSSRMIVSK